MYETRKLRLAIKCIIIKERESEVDINQQVLAIDIGELNFAVNGYDLIKETLLLIHIINCPFGYWVIFLLRNSFSHNVALSDQEKNRPD